MFELRQTQNDFLYNMLWYLLCSILWHWICWWLMVAIFFINTCTFQTNKVTFNLTTEMIHQVYLSTLLPFYYEPIRIYCSVASFSISSTVIIATLLVAILCCKVKTMFMYVHWNFWTFVVIKGFQRFTLYVWICSRLHKSSASLMLPLFCFIWWWLAQISAISNVK